MMKLLDFIRTGNQRSLIVKRNIAFSALVKIVSIIVSLMLVPMTINYVNSEVYGIWLTLSSVIGWLSFFDIGFGLGLRNRLTTALAHGDYCLGKKYVSTTYCVLFLIFIPIAIIGIITAHFIPWCSLLNVSDSYYDTLVTTSQIVIASFCFNVVLKLIQNVCQAYQMTALASVFDTIGSIVSLVFIYILTVIAFPSLNFLALAFCSPALLVLIISSLFLYKTKFKNVSPSRDSINFRFARDIFSLGSRFFFIQIVYLILFQATNFVISHYCGPEQVTVYNVAHRYLNCVIMALNIIMAPIWSAYNDAHAKKDYTWMLSVYRKLCLLNVLVIVGIGLLIILSPFVYYIWLGNSVTVPIVVTVLVGTNIAFLSISNLSATILNGLGVVRLQMAQAIFQCVIYISLVPYMATKYGIVGILICMIITSVVSASVLPVQVRKLLKQTAIGFWLK